MQKVLRSFIKRPRNLLHKSAEAHTHSLHRILVNSISKKCIRNFYHFNGTSKSFIILNTPICTLGKGFCWTGYIYPELTTTPRQCLISFMNHSESHVRGFEVCIENGKLNYSLVNTQSSSKRATYTAGEIPASQWCHITFAHVGRQLVIFLNKVQYVMDVPTQVLPKEYNVAVIGANVDGKSLYPCDFFVGEMSVQYFYHPTALFVACMKDVVVKDNYLELLYEHEDRLEELCSNNGPELRPMYLSLIHICRCRRIERCRSRWSPYH
eukprot:TRINITY_DN13019_c0_g1_i1.p1 TRINITY_DN13019_c0_g1~~TRINITY_DN13019_c0_g1_i1.p1  ORF type:complete len:267 (+),score=70.20 TRINITY_DN13019_c0_g1_i1:122-922(+)